MSWFQLTEMQNIFANNSCHVENSFCPLFTPGGDGGKKNPDDFLIEMYIEKFIYY